ncbi:MAG TPA: serine hydrolase domain-containing protein [Pseudomonadales bacterium]|nr:serine hydrolase domain-containing protein [Pseudomonadales bacterium]
MATISLADSSSEHKFSEIRKAAEVAMQDANVPGLALGIIYKSEEYTTGIGVTNVDHPQSVDADTLFAIGSVTKTFTASAMMSLIEEGLLQLDTPVTDILPMFRVADMQATKQVKVVDLFQHRTGWLGDHIDDTGQGDDALDRVMWQLRYLPQITPFGEVWTYNNVNYMIAGKIMEEVTGQLVEQVIMDRIVKPLGMVNSGFDPRHLLSKKLAVGHAASTDDQVINISDVATFRSVYPAGGLRSTARDMLKYASFQLNHKHSHGEGVLKPATLALMQQPLVSAEMDDWTGISWFGEDIQGVKVIHHGGRWIGMTSKLVVVPEKDFAIVVMTNSDRGSEVYGEIITKALKDFLGLEREELKTLPFDRQSLAPFVGMFRGNLEDFRFYFDKDQLWVERLYKAMASGKSSVKYKPVPPMPVSLVGQNKVMITSGANAGVVGELIEDATGEFPYLRMMHRIYLRED